MKIAHKFVLLLQFGVVSALFGQPTQNTDFSVGVEVLGVEGFYLSPGVLASYRASSLLELGAGYYSSKRTLFRPETNLLFQSDAVDEYNNNSARAFANLYPLDIPLYANVAYGVLPSRSIGGTSVLTDPTGYTANLLRVSTNTFVSYARIEQDRSFFGSAGLGFTHTFLSALRVDVGAGVLFLRPPGIHVVPYSLLYPASSPSIAQYALYLGAKDSAPKSRNLYISFSAAYRNL